MTEAALSVRDICVEYGTHRVVDHASFDIAPGEFVGLIGPNGGGKTTLVKAALGLLPTSCGEVRIFGTPVGRFREHHRVGYVPQHAVHVDVRFPATAYEVALLGRIGRRTLFRRLTREDHDRVRDAMREVGVHDLADKRIGTLSGGQRQRVFLAKALASEPDLVILDEPTTGVDPGARDRFLTLLDHLNRSHGMSIALITHDTHAVLRCASRLLAVNRHIVYDGSPREFEAHGGFEAAYEVHHHHHDDEPDYAHPKDRSGGESL